MGFAVSKSFSTLPQNAWLFAWSAITGYIHRVTVLRSEPLPDDPHPVAARLRAATTPTAAAFFIGGFLSKLIPVLTET
ncbi:hypothetical protein GCM10022224_063370 [Nonomuraea antimicrobica]|uniref:Uncharacterized protein n=1 Tax=Nonomuraea antimicrobica TaxID=561173 RepID=A0ABP7CGX0_9ACTN